MFLFRQGFGHHGRPRNGGGKRCCNLLARRLDRDRQEGTRGQSAARDLPYSVALLF